MESFTWTKEGPTLLEFDDSNPHKSGTAAYAKYEAIKTCGSVQEVRKKGGSAWDLADYHKKGKVRVLEVVRPKVSKGWGKDGGGKGGKEGGKKGVDKEEGGKIEAEEATKSGSKVLFSFSFLPSSSFSLLFTFWSSLPFSNLKRT